MTSRISRGSRCILNKHKLQVILNVTHRRGPSSGLNVVVRSCCPRQHSESQAASFQAIAHSTLRCPGRTATALAQHCPSSRQPCQRALSSPALTGVDVWTRPQRAPAPNLPLRPSLPARLLMHCMVVIMYQCVEAHDCATRPRPQNAILHETRNAGTDGSVYHAVRLFERRSAGGRELPAPYIHNSLLRKFTNSDPTRDIQSHRSSAVARLERISVSSGRGFAGAHASPPSGAMMTLRPPRRFQMLWGERRGWQVGALCYLRRSPPCCTRLPLVDRRPNGMRMRR